MIKCMQTAFRVYEVHRKNGEIVYYVQCRRSDFKGKRMSRCFHSQEEAFDFASKNNDMWQIFHQTGVNLEQSESSAEAVDTDKSYAETVDSDVKSDCSNDKPSSDWKLNDVILWHVNNYEYTNSERAEADINITVKNVFDAVDHLNLSDMPCGC